MIYQLDSDTAKALFEAVRYGHLGCIVDDEPYVVPVRYVAEGDFAYLHSTPGRKIDGMREARRVCLQVEQLEGEYHWRSVQVFGDYEEIHDEGERERVLDLLFNAFPRLTPADALRRQGHSLTETIAFRLRINRIVGIGEG